MAETVPTAALRDQVTLVFVLPVTVAEIQLWLEERGASLRSSQ